MQHRPVTRFRRPSMALVLVPALMAGAASGRAQEVPKGILRALQASEASLRTASGHALYHETHRANDKYLANLDEDTRRAMAHPYDETFHYEWLVDGLKFWTKRLVPGKKGDGSPNRELRVNAWDGKRCYRYESFLDVPNFENACLLDDQPGVALIPFTAGYDRPFSLVSDYVRKIGGRYEGTIQEGGDRLAVVSGEESGYRVKVWLSERHGYLASRVDRDKAVGGTAHLSTQVLRWGRQGDVWIPMDSSHEWIVKKPDGDLVTSNTWRIVLDDVKVNAGERFALDIPDNVVLTDGHTQDRYKTDGKGGIRLIERGAFHKDVPFSLWPALFVGSVASLIGTGVSKVGRLLMMR